MLHVWLIEVHTSVTSQPGTVKRINTSEVYICLQVKDFGSKEAEILN